MAEFRANRAGLREYLRSGELYPALERAAAPIEARAKSYAPVETAADAAEQFQELLAGVLTEKKHVTEPAMAVQKRVAAYGAAVDGSVERIRFAGPGLDVNGVTTLQLSSPAALPREWLGAGSFGYGTVEALADLAPIVRRKDQTVSQFGFTSVELTAFARELAGRGVDRIVPFGAALNFSPIWDGYDLLAEFSRLVTVAP